MALQQHFKAIDARRMKQSRLIQYTPISALPVGSAVQDLIGIAKRGSRAFNRDADC
jgi:hypothetical protein